MLKKTIEMSDDKDNEQTREEEAPQADGQQEETVDGDDQGTELPQEETAQEEEAAGDAPKRKMPKTPRHKKQIRKRKRRSRRRNVRENVRERLTKKSWTLTAT